MIDATSVPAQRFSGAAYYCSHHLLHPTGPPSWRPAPASLLLLHLSEETDRRGLVKKKTRRRTGACDACCEQSGKESEPEHPPHERRSLHTCAQEHNDSLRQRLASSHPRPFWPQRFKKPVLWRWLKRVFFWSRRMTCLCQGCSARRPSMLPCCAVTHFVCCSQRYWIVRPHQAE